MPDAIVAVLTWPYVVGVAVLPIIAICIAMMSQRHPDGTISVPNAYLVLLFGGFAGLHRLFLKNIWWVLYVPLLAFFIYVWTLETRSSAEFSKAKEQLEEVDSALARQQARDASATAGIDALRAQLVDTTPKSETAIAALELEIERERARAIEARAEIAKIDVDVPVLKEELMAATNDRRFWSDLAYKTLLVILAFMAIDALLIPTLKRAAEMRAKAREDVNASS